MSDEARMSGGSLPYWKLNFDDVTVEHDCVLPGEFLIFVLSLFGEIKNSVDLCSTAERHKGLRSQRRMQNYQNPLGNCDFEKASIDQKALSIEQRRLQGNYTSHVQ